MRKANCAFRIFDIYEERVQFGINKILQNVTKMTQLVDSKDEE